MEKTIKELECLRCGHKWYPRVSTTPKRCPQCTSPYWQKPKKESGVEIPKEINP